MTDAVLTVAAVAGRLGCSPDTVLDLIHSGDLPARKLKPSAKRPTYRITEEGLATYCRKAGTVKPARAGRTPRTSQLPEIANATRYV